MNKNSNTYIFLYASIMVIVVASILSAAAITLKPFQDKNKEIEKKKDILKSVELSKVPADVKDADSYIEKTYEKFITKDFVINSEGKVNKGVSAVKIKLKVELTKPMGERNLPLFIATLKDGSKKIIIPVQGKGLWGPIWGYISLNDDYNTIYGATFDHKAETPGLGADINKEWFQSHFKDKKLFEEGEFKSVKVIKGGASPSDLHGVDAISGGTITSKGLEAMLYDCLIPYEKYFKSQMN